MTTDDIAYRASGLARNIQFLRDPDGSDAAASRRDASTSYSLSAATSVSLAAEECRS